LLPKGKKLVVEEVAEKDAFTKVFKIIGKKIMNKGKIQYNLFGGKNFISDIQVRVNDSLLWDLKQNKTVKHLPLKENAKAIIVAGRNVGVEGVIIKIKGDNINIKTKDKTLEVPIKNIWVVG
jgi:ribosomal protein S4E